MQKTDIKTKIFIIATIIIVIITITLYMYKESKKENTLLYGEYISAENEENVQENNVEENNNITIHITGEIKYPGVVVLKNGARIVDAIEAAGGESEDADLDKLNLAYILSDGDKIYIPNKYSENIEDNIISMENELESDKQSIININTASKEELTQLPGIGEATASKIIEYRKQNGKFETIEELKNVPGIGNSKFENLKNKIRLK